MRFIHERDYEPWMSNPSRNCALPAEFAPEDVRVVADLWFPGDPHEAAEARRLCAGCVVATQCLAYALEHPSLEGIWGGTSFGGRQRLRSRARAAVA